MRLPNTPAKVQDLLNTLRMRTPGVEPIVRSPSAALAAGDASCMEGALIAVAALHEHSVPVWLLDLKVDTRANDVDHVVALFKQDGFYGAISKTNHGVLRYREPLYKTVREVVMSYFHEYFLDTGIKTLRSFSKPYDVVKKHGTAWITSTEDLYEIAYALDCSPHTDIAPASVFKKLRKADAIEIEAGSLKEWK
jgi:hypothetical protein